MQRYFTVQYEDESDTYTAEPALGQNGGADNSEKTDVLREWDAALEQRRQAIDVAEAQTAKTDYTLWFKRTR